MMHSITIETNIVVASNRTTTLRLPPEITPGKHRAILVIDETPKLPLQQTGQDIPEIHVKQWPEQLSLRREDMYGDQGR